MKEKKKLNLVLGSHAHVPSGSPESYFQSVYDNVMRPFVCNLYRYSNIQAVMHYSGVLLYWVERTHPEFFMLIEDMVARKQAEIIGGGFYEPMFPLIPLQDRIGQIELLTTYLRRHFGKRPAGCWIPYGNWEQNLVSALAASDMNYTFLSQNQFEKAGLTGNELFYPCISEDQGKLVTVFPVSFRVEEELSKKSCSQVFIDMKNGEEYVFDGAETIISVFPENISCAEEESKDMAWNRFFEELSLSNDFVETVLPGKILKSGAICKRASFANSSFKNGDLLPRDLLISCGEANGIYSKMIFVNVLISQLKGDKYRKQNAREELWKAQDADLFTGSTSGMRGDLRKAAYSSLLRAEKLSREKGRFIQSLIQHDFDLDGEKEYLFQDALINCYIQTRGAGIFELDYLAKDWNYLDCGYMSGKPRKSFGDVLLPSGINTEELEKGFPAQARLCFNEKYEELSRTSKGKSCFKLSAAEGAFGNIEINKCYMLKRDILTVTYTLKNTGKDTFDFCFTPEINFSFAGVGEEYVRFYTVENGEKDVPVEKELKESSNLKILDVVNEVQILLSSINEFSLCLFHVHGNGYYQASRILPVFSITLESGKTWSNEFCLKFSS